MIEVEYVERRADASFELEIRYPSPELVERIVQTLAVEPVQKSSVEIAGLTFEGLVVSVEIDPQCECDVLKVRARLKPTGDTA